MIAIILGVLLILFCIVHRCCFPQCKVMPVVKACICAPCYLGKCLCGSNQKNNESNGKEKQSVSKEHQHFDEQILADMLEYIENGRVVKKNNKLVIELGKRKRSPSFEQPLTNIQRSDLIARKMKRSNSIDSVESFRHIQEATEARKRKKKDTKLTIPPVRGALKPFQVRALFPSRNNVC